MNDTQLFQALVNNKAIIMMMGDEKIALYIEDDGVLNIAQWCDESTASDNTMTYPAGWHDCIECSGYDVIAERHERESDFEIIDVVDRFETYVSNDHGRSGEYPFKRVLELLLEGNYLFCVDLNDAETVDGEVCDGDSDAYVIGLKDDRLIYISCNELSSEEPELDDICDSVYLEDYLDRSLFSNPISVSLIPPVVPKDDTNLILFILDLEEFKNYRQKNPID